MEHFKNVIEFLEKQKDLLSEQCVSENNIFSYENKLYLVCEYIDAIEILKFREKQRLNSLYGYQVTNNLKIERYKNVDLYLILNDKEDTDFRNVDVEIKYKFIRVYNGTRYFNYNINNVTYFEVKERSETDDNIREDN